MKSPHRTHNCGNSKELFWSHVLIRESSLHPPYQCRLAGKRVVTQKDSKSQLCPLAVLYKCKGLDFNFAITKMPTKVLGDAFDRLPVLGNKLANVVEKVLCARAQTVVSDINDCTEVICTEIFARISKLKKEDVKMTLKQRALKDLYDALKANGLTDVAHVSTQSSGNLMVIFEMPIPVVQNYLEQLNATKMTDALVHKELSQLWAKSDQYHYKGISQLQLLRGSLIVSRFEFSFPLFFCSFELLCSFVSSLSLPPNPNQDHRT
jgi:hypothetical protein